MPDNGPEKRSDWLSLRVPGAPAIADYEFAERAAEAHALYCNGYEIEEIAAIYEVSEADIQKDLAHIHKNLTSRQTISMNNDRQRIMIQKTNFKKYKRILDESLTITAQNYLAAGLSPVPAMKEFREAVSMTEKPGGLSISFTKNTANIGMPNPVGGIHPANLGGRRSGIRSYEDLVRMIIQEDPSCGLQPIDADAQDVTSSQSLDDITDEIDTNERLEDSEEMQ